MKVLFCSTGGAGHIQPMRPLATALQRRGHAVGWVTAPDALPGLAGQGMALFPAGPTFEVSRHQFRHSHPEIRTLRAEPLSVETFAGLFGDTLAPAMLDGFDSAADRWQPDLVVLEPAALAAPLVCERRGLLHVTHGYGLTVPTAQLSAALRRFGGQWQALGLQPPADGGLYRHLYIDIAPASLSCGLERPAVSLLASNPYQSTTIDRDKLPDDLRAALTSTGRPRVYLSFGTVFHRQPALANAAQALVDLGAEVVVTIGPDNDPCHWGPSSSHLHVRRFVDQAQLLPHCDAVVSHGGAGTVLGAAAHGLPQLVLPQGADHFRNARALCAVSAGLALDPGSQTCDLIRSQAARLLASATHAAAATRLAEEMRSMPTAADVAQALEALVSNGRAGGAA